jgi:hypothetical protein
VLFREAGEFMRITESCCEQDTHEKTMFAPRVPGTHCGCH